jgi:DNA-binding transcriptional MerR regulator
MDGQQPSEAGVMPLLLDGWLSKERLAAEIGVSTDTLERWERRRLGPPRVKLGRKAFYRIDALREWLRSQESFSNGKGNKGFPRKNRGSR